MIEWSNLEIRVVWLKCQTLYFAPTLLDLTSFFIPVEGGVSDLYGTDSHFRGLGIFDFQL